jgi:hypothetical protein
MMTPVVAYKATVSGCVEDLNVLARSIRGRALRISRWLMGFLLLGAG